MEWIAGLLVSGFCLVVLEMFLPGIVLGVLGFLCLLLGVVLSYINYGLVTGTWIFSGVLLAGLVIVLFWMKYFPKVGPGRKLLLETESAGTSGPERLDWAGQEGEALTDLRPAGTARILGNRADVVAESDLIERGSRIKVVAVEGTKVVVRRAD
jgi:membrane-bound serine protease (ClpP class)